MFECVHAYLRVGVFGCAREGACSLTLHCSSSLHSMKYRAVNSGCIFFPIVIMR